MNFLSSLDSKDRRMLLIILGMISVLLVALALFTRSEDPNSNTMPGSDLSGQHGAKAAFTLLGQSGYSVERWERPLRDLASQAGPGTVVILAEPYSFERTDRFAVAAILRKGGRVLATGFQGGMLLPGNEVTFSKDVSFAACEAQPDGLGPLAGSGPIWIVPRATWIEARPEIRADYACAGQPVVVEYPVGAGTAIWWASSTPLENGSIQRGQNLELLLNSVGPTQIAGQPQHVYWDESLHSLPPTQWDFAEGPVWPLLAFGSIGLALLVVFSMSRRSGPVRPLPQPPRTTPIEFLEALGALYRSTGATATALQIGRERFRSQAALLTGQNTAELDARELAAAIERRFGPVALGIEADLVAVEEACWDEALKPRRALALIQALRRHEDTLREASAHARTGTAYGTIAAPGVTLGS